jgi:hypothetical protein
MEPGNLQHTYWEQVLSNVGHWLGFPVTSLDFIILVPLVPLLSLGLVMWLPWEQWLWKHLPKQISGPYLLYVAFALWHFHVHWWWVFIAAVGGLVMTGIALIEYRQREQP